jgi:hypothetical protein
VEFEGFFFKNVCRTENVPAYAMHVQASEGDTKEKKGRGRH